MIFNNSDPLISGSPEVCYECGKEISKTKVDQEWLGWVEKFLGDSYEGAPIFMFSGVGDTPSIWDRWHYEMNHH